MRRALTILIWLLVAAYVFALGIFLISVFGLFGTERDPLSGIFLIPLGLPWIRLHDVFGEGLRPWLAILAPAFNILLLLALKRSLARGK